MTKKLRTTIRLSTLFGIILIVTGVAFLLVGGSTYMKQLTYQEVNTVSAKAEPVSVQTKLPPQPNHVSKPQKYESVKSVEIYNPPPPPPPAVIVSGFANRGNMQDKIDACRGAILVSGFGRPLITQHNYCGGTGQVIDIKNAQGLSGRYKVVSMKVVSKKSNPSILNSMGSVVLQTCTGNQLLLTGVNRI